MTCVRDQNVEQICMGKATFAPLLLPPQISGPKCPAEMGTQCRSQPCPVQKPALPTPLPGLPRCSLPGIPGPQHKLWSAHTFPLCFRPEPGEYIPTQSSFAGPQGRHISPLNLQSLQFACSAEAVRMDKTNLFLIQCKISYSWLFFS